LDWFHTSSARTSEEVKVTDTKALQHVIKVDTSDGCYTCPLIERETWYCQALDLMGVRETSCTDGLPALCPVRAGGVFVEARGEG
jgi:hypothetical protein